MNNLVIKKVEYQETKIEFRDDINLIIGDNATGKSTIFKLLKYALGLMSNHSELAYLKGEKIIVTCQIGSSDYDFKRVIGEKKIHVYSNENTSEFNVISSSFSEFLCEVFTPNYEYLPPIKSIKRIIRYYFFNGETYGHLVQIPIQKLILGYEADYLNILKETIKEYSKTLNELNQSNTRLKEFVDVVTQRIASELASTLETDKTNIINNIIMSEYAVNIDKYSESKNLLDEAKNTYDKIRKESNSIVEDRFESLKLESSNLKTGAYFKEA